MNEVRIKAVIIDDEQAMCLGAERVLRDFIVDIPDIETRASFSVKKFSRGQDFIEYLKNESPDVILLDYKLPDMTGLDILQHVTSQNIDAITIMITAYATFETAVQATKLGAYDFIAKPFTPDELRYSVRKATLHLMLARHARKSDEERRRVRFQFISVLSHELKAPLAAIEGYLNILRKRFGKISEQDYEMMLNRSLLRLDGMRKMIFDLLDMTRIESGEKKRNFEKINLCDVIRSSVELVAFDAIPRNIKINVNIPDVIEFVADKGEMDIIFNNLITNSVKYNKDNGTVDINIANIDGGVQIKVSDTGIGIEPEDAKRLFNDFVRIKNEQTINILGSGLGLSTVKKLVSLYNGTVKLDSTPGVGSTFTVELGSNVVIPDKIDK
jgi:two-component system, sensor histidine kinase and response regulator